MCCWEEAVVSKGPIRVTCGLGWTENRHRLEPRAEACGFAVPTLPTLGISQEASEKIPHAVKHPVRGCCAHGVPLLSPPRPSRRGSFSHRVRGTYCRTTLEHCLSPACPLHSCWISFLPTDTSQKSRIPGTVSWVYRVVRLISQGLAITIGCYFSITLGM